MVNSTDLVASFAKLQAHEDARMVVQEVLHAATLPQDHPLSGAQNGLAHGPQLLAGIRFHLAILLGRLEIGHHREIASTYTSAYTHQFLRSLQQELRTYLVGAYQGLMPDESHATAREALGVVEGLLLADMASQEGGSS